MKIESNGKTMQINDGEMGKWIKYIEDNFDEKHESKAYKLLLNVLLNASESKTEVKPKRSPARRKAVNNVKKKRRW